MAHQRPRPRHRNAAGSGGSVSPWSTILTVAGGAALGAGGALVIAKAAPKVDSKLIALGVGALGTGVAAMTAKRSPTFSKLGVGIAAIGVGLGIIDVMQGSHAEAAPPPVVQQAPPPKPLPSHTDSHTTTVHRQASVGEVSREEFEGLQRALEHRHHETVGAMHEIRNSVVRIADGMHAPPELSDDHSGHYGHYGHGHDHVHENRNADGHDGHEWLPEEHSAHRNADWAELVPPPSDHYHHHEHAA